MYNISFFLLSVTMTVVAIWIVQKFLDIFLLRKKRNIVSISVWSIFAVYQLIIMYGYGQALFWTPFIMILLFLCISILGYHKAGKIKLFLALILYVVWILVEMMVFFFLGNMPIEKSTNDVIGTIISKIIMIIGINIITIFWRKKENGFIPTKYLLILLLFPIGTIYIVFFEYYSGGYHDNTIFSMIVLSILLLFNIEIFELFPKLGKILDYEKEKAVYTQHIHSISQNTEEKEKMMKEFHNEKHNFINELIALKECVLNNEKDIVIDSFENIIKKISDSEAISNSGNLTVDALINDKYAIAKEKNIAFKLKITIPEVLPFDQCDIGILIGNALDNAIEAVTKCKIYEKCISISMGVKKKSLVLMINNPYESSIIKDESGNFRTMKMEALKHGYGLSSIIRTVDKYGGELFIETDDNIFSLTIILNSSNFNRISPNFTR